MAHAFQTEKTLSSLFFTQAEKFAADPFLFAKFKKGAPASRWKALTWKQAADQARNLAAGLIELGINQGERIAIFAENRPRWVIADQAIQASGAWGVPIYPTSTDEQLAYILKDCKARAVFTGDPALTEQVFRLKPSLPDLGFIISMSPLKNAIAGALNFDELVASGAKSEKALAEAEARRKSLTGDDIAAIIYTSGTTGEPKGAVLTQTNFMSDLDMLLDSTITKKMIDRGIRLSSLCHLPLCHIYGRTSDYHVQMAMAGSIYFAESYQKVPQNLREVRPQMLITIPRLYEKVYEMVQVQGSRLQGLQKKIFDWGFRIGNQVTDHLSSGKKMPFLLALQFGLAATLVYNKIKKAAGLDRLVFAASGGGALARETNRFFRAMNIQVVEGYGLTETTSAVTWNAVEFLQPLPDKWIYRKALDWLIDTIVVMQSKGQNPFAHPMGMLKLSVASALVLPRLIQKPGTVGRPCKGTEIKIAEDGEILVKGPQIFQKNRAYLNRAELSQECFTEDGFFRTGDIGHFDQDGFLVITDRKKELLVTAGGKNIAPHPIELALALDTMIEQACVVGDAKKFIAALLVPQFELLERWAGEKGLSFRSREELVKNPEVRKLYEAKVAKVNEKLARYEQIKKFLILPVVFTEQGGELTPTQKLKRRNIYKRFADEIGSLYSSDSLPEPKI